MVSIKNKEQIEKMREACRVANLAQTAVEAAIRPGISTWELDKIAERTGRTRNEIIQMCLEFAVDNLEVKEDDR